MKRITAVAMALILLAASVFMAGFGKKKPVLTLYTWMGMFPEEILEAYTRETGTEINYVSFDTDEAMLAKLEAAEGGDYDLVIADDYIVETVIQEGLAQKLDISKLENYASLNPVFMSEYYDPENEYTVPYGAGIMEFAYYPEKTGFAIKAYEDLWNPALEGRVGIIANPRVIIGMALKCLGYSFNTTDEAQIREAGELLYKLAPNIRLIKDDYINDDLLSGEIDAAFCYTSNATIAKLTDPAVEIALPAEGLGYGVMPMFIPAKAPNAEAAYQFIDFINRPENAALCFEYLGYYCTNADAEALISDEIRSMVTLPENTTNDREMIENIPGEIYDVHEEIWNTFKNLCS